MLQSAILFVSLWSKFDISLFGYPKTKVKFMIDEQKVFLQSAEMAMHANGAAHFFDA